MKDDVNSLDRLCESAGVGNVRLYEVNVCGARRLVRPAGALVPSEHADFPGADPPQFFDQCASDRAGAPRYEDACVSQSFRAHREILTSFVYAPVTWPRFFAGSMGR